MSHNLPEDDITPTKEQYEWARKWGRHWDLTVEQTNDLAQELAKREHVERRPTNGLGAGLEDPRTGLIPGEDADWHS